MLEEDGLDRPANWPKQRVTRSFVNRCSSLTLLAPEIVEAILDGRQPKGLQLAEHDGGEYRAPGRSRGDA